MNFKGKDVLKNETKKIEIKENILGCLTGLLLFHSEFDKIEAKKFYLRIEK